MKPLVEQVKEKYKEKIYIEDCDVGNQAAAALAAKYKVNGVPTMLFIDKKGVVVDSIIGFGENATIEHMSQSIDSILR